MQAIIRSCNQPFQIVKSDTDINTSISGDEVLINIKCCGLCHTDLHIIKDDLHPYKNWTKPCICGHEGVGEVVKVGNDVTDRIVGDLVGIPWLFSTCMQCEFCLKGRENLCLFQENTCINTEGCFQEYKKMKSSFSVKLSRNVSMTDLAPLLCAGVTAYKAIKETNTKPGDYIAIVGASGGLGSYACQYARLMGLRVIALDTTSAKVKYCKDELLVEEAYSTRENDHDHIISCLNEVTSGGCHGVINFAPSKDAFNLSIYCTRRSGTCVMVALADSAATFDVPINHMVMNGVTIKGSIVGTRQDMIECLSFADRGLIKSNVTVFNGLQSINEAVAALNKGEANGRAVILF